MSDHYEELSEDDGFEELHPDDEDFMDWGSDDHDPDDDPVDPTVKPHAGTLDPTAIAAALGRVGNPTDDVLAHGVVLAENVKMLLGDKDELAHRIGEDLEYTLRTVHLECQYNPGRLITRAQRARLIVSDDVVVAEVLKRNPNPNPATVTTEYLATVRDELLAERHREVLKTVRTTRDILRRFERQLTTMTTEAGEGGG